MGYIKLLIDVDGDVNMAPKGKWFKLLDLRLLLHKCSVLQIPLKRALMLVTEGPDVRRNDAAKSLILH